MHPPPLIRVNLKKNSFIESTIKQIVKSKDKIFLHFKIIIEVIKWARNKLKIFPNIQ